MLTRDELDLMLLLTHAVDHYLTGTVEGKIMVAPNAAAVRARLGEKLAAVLQENGATVRIVGAGDPAAVDTARAIRFSDDADVP